MEATHNVPARFDHGAGWSSWVVEVEKLIGESSRSAEMARWSKRSIYRVPAWIKNLRTGSNAYRPRMVSLGPFHHGASDLVAMEEHKRRAAAHLVRRSGRPLREFAAAVEGVVEQLQDAYEDLAAEWTTARERFVDLMLTDGCFLLEVLRMRAAGAQGNLPEDYAPNDPIFSRHGYLQSWGILQGDMLVMENQLPLLLLHTLVTVQRGTAPSAKQINYMVLEALRPYHPDVVTLNHDLGLHVLDIHHKSFGGDAAHHEDTSRRDQLEFRDMPTALELHEARIRFRGTTADLRGIHFEGGVLSIPTILFTDVTEFVFLNMLAFERLHPNSRNYVTDYVIFMSLLIDSAADVALLESNEVIVNYLGSREELATLISMILSKEAIISKYSKVPDVHRQLRVYCRNPCNKWRASLVQTYFRNPWVFISLVAAVVLLVASVMQTIYTVVPFYRKKGP